MTDLAISHFRLQTDAAAYVNGYRDPQRFLALCRQCGNFGACWACPPFDFDWTQKLLSFSSVSLFMTKIEFADKSLTYADVEPEILKVRREVESKLRSDEKRTGGLAFAFAGKCLYCPELECTRKSGEPCRHPELVRPSLEAVGFDISKTVKDYFDTEILWGENGRVPKYLLLVSALFHN